MCRMRLLNRRITLCLMLLGQAGWASAKGEPTPAEAVVLLHGIMNKAFIMDRMAAALRREGYQVYNWGYPSTGGLIEEHAARLAKYVNGLPEPQVSFVGFSQGAIIIRYMLTHYPIRKAGRLVMVAP